MILVDAYNVLHATSALPPDLSGLGLDDLADLIGQSRYANRPVRLVCDGTRPATVRGSAEPAGDFRIMYAGRGREADDVIEQLLRDTTYPRETLVVSSDRRIRRAAGRRGARSLAADAFLGQLAADRNRERQAPLPSFATQIPLDAYSVAVWAQEFGYGALRPDPSVPVSNPRPQGPAHDGKSDGPARTWREWHGASASLAAAAGSPLQLPQPSPRTPPVRVTSPQAPVAKAAAGQVDPPAVPDPWISEALRVWAGRITPEDLDMRRWV